MQEDRPPGEVGERGGRGMERGKETGHFEAAGGRAFESEALALRSQAGWLCDLPAGRVGGWCGGQAGTALLRQGWQKESAPF